MYNYLVGLGDLSLSMNLHVRSCLRFVRVGKGLARQLALAIKSENNELSHFCCLTSFSGISRELVALLLLSFGYYVTVNVLWLFLTVPWVCMHCVIVVFSHIHLHFFLLLEYPKDEIHRTLCY